MAIKTINDTILTDIANAIRNKKNVQDTYLPSKMAEAINSISSGESFENISYVQCNEAVNNFINDVSYDSNDYTVSSIETYASEVTDKDKPLGCNIITTENGVFILVNNNHTMQQDINSGNNTIYNIVPNTQGTFVIRNDNGEITKAGTITSTGSGIRMIQLNDTRNVRDLGGWSCDGGTIKYGKLFRGSRLFINYEDNKVQNLNEYDLNVLHNLLGIQSELDLRYSNEVHYNYSLIGKDVDYMQIDGAWYSITDETKCKTILEKVMDCAINNIPLYFHCAGGADRTATVAMWIEAILGVSQSDIDKEYELTCFYSGVATDAQARRRNENNWISLITAFDSYPGNNLNKKVLAWVISLGISIDKINAFRLAMINGNPEIIENPYGNTTVTKTLSHITIDNPNSSVEMYQPYTATLSADIGYSLNSININIIMNGIDVTTNCYQNGIITIPKVTGAITITASVANMYVNQILHGTAEIGGTELYNDIGYKQESRWTSSNIEESIPVQGIPNMFAVGYIKVQPGDVVRLYGDIWKGTSGGIVMHVRDASNNSLVRSTLNNWSNDYTTRSDIMAYMTDIDYDNTTKTLHSFKWTGGTNAIDGYMHWTFVGTFNENQTILTINEEI